MEKTIVNNIPVDEEARRTLFELAITNHDRDMLHEWLIANLGIDVPRVAVCPDHCAPFDFVADYLFEISDFMIVVANRSGGKTMAFGFLDAIMAWYQGNTEISTVGAIQFQAQKAYEYFKAYSSEYPFSQNIISHTMAKTHCLNKSSVQILTGTMSGVNCLSGDTLIDCPRDLSKYQKGIPIKDLVGKEFYTYSFDIADNRFCLKKATHVRKTGEKIPVYKVTFGWNSHGTGEYKQDSITGTDFHPLLLKDGTYKEIGKLVVGDRLQPFFVRDRTKVISVEFAGYEDVYDMTVEGTENFIANGIVVHNSPHPQLVFLDEIDLMPWQILQQALSMPQSKGKVRSRTVLTSTRKFANGPMQRMVDEANEKKAKVYMWCIWEVAQKLPTTNLPLMQRIKSELGSALPANINEADGYYDWQDLLTKFSTLDSEVWETEWLCKRPGLEGVIYGSAYSDDNNMVNFDPTGKEGYIYLWEDFGYGEGHPDVVLLVFIPPEFDRAIIVDELYMTKLGTQEIWETIEDMLRPYGYSLPNRSRGVAGSLTGWIGDPHGFTEIADRVSRGAPMMEKATDPELYIVNNRIPIVRRMLQSGRLMISRKCINLRMEFLSYKRKKNLDGTYSMIPEKKNDHGMDAIGYGLVVLYERLAALAFRARAESITPVAPDRQKPAYQTSAPDKPITAGLLSGNNKGWR